MLGRDRVIELIKRLVKESEAHQTEVVYVGIHKDSTRFANSAILQNMKESNRRVYIRTILNKRVGVSSTNSLHMEDLRRSLKRSLELAQHQPPLPFFKSLPEGSHYQKVITYYPETTGFSAEDKAKGLKEVFKRARGKKITIGGNFSTDECEVGIVNSLGVKAYQPFTSACISLIASTPTGSGYSTQFVRDIRKIDLEALGNRAMERSLMGKRPRELKPGMYTVLLEPPAVNGLLEWLIFIGLGAQAYQDGTSFITRRIGKRVTGGRITIYDDGLDPEGLLTPFDFEGTAKKRLTLIDKGVARGIAYDTLMAQKEGKATTGHALLPDDLEGPFPTNVFIKEGKTPFHRMLGSIERGILVTRFHYVNGLLDPSTASMTGMTRDGTFYVEDGRIRYPVRDVRFTESILSAFSRVEAVSRERQAFPNPWSDIGANVVPAILIKDFNLSG